MKSQRILPLSWRSRRGSILAVAMFLVLMVAIAGGLMLRTFIDQQKLNDRRHSVRQAYYAAEGGIALVQHWGNFPDEFTPDDDIFSWEEDYSHMRAAMTGNNYLIDAQDLALMGVHDLTSDYGYAVGSIQLIELLPPAVGDPVACLFKVRSVGVSPDGIERTILTYMDLNPLVTETGPVVPGALLSLDTAAASGNARIHWGEAWSSNDFDMMNKSQMGYLDPSNASYDPWAGYRTEGQINFPASWKWGAGKDLFDPAATQPGESPASGDYEDAFFQHLPPGSLTFPDLAGEYQHFKDLALANGQYYSTDAAGNIYRDGVEVPANDVDFLDEFGLADRSGSTYDYAFIDTIDGNPPAADGSNIATISVAGGSPSIKGVFYICANFDISGVGMPPSLEGTDPDGTVSTITNIFLDGLLYASGTVSLSGNSGVFGAVISEKGFTGGGTPDIYYNIDLADGLDLELGNVGSRFRILLQTNYGS